MRFAQAYLMIARDLEYRPAKPNDFPPETRDASTYIHREAVAYAMDFASAEDGDMRFYVGCSNYNTNRAFVFCIEAARLLASGSEGDKYSDYLLRLAINEIAAAQLLKRKKLT